MVDMSSRTEIKKRFHALGAERERKLALSAPLRARRDALVTKARAEELELNKQIKAAEVGLYEIDVERAALARAVGGQTGEPK